MKRLLDTDVRYFDQDSFNIPKLENKWGCMVDFLDSTLTKGSLEQDVLYMVTTEEEDYWISTLTLAKGHGFKQNLSVVEIIGCPEEVYNRKFRVQKVTEDSIEIAFDKNLYSIKPTEVIPNSDTKIFLSPLGYQKVFEAPQKAVYKTANIMAKQAYLRVDNSCPESHDPSWTKFSRISMFSEMEYLDDYEYKIGRIKSPATSGNYNLVEKGIQDIWIYTRQWGSYTYELLTTNNQELLKYFIIGDDKTFYIHLYDTMNVNNPTDTTFTFGEYEKLIYKEDPLPFVLRTLNRLEGNIFQHYYSYSENFMRDRTHGKHTFSSLYNENFSDTSSVNWSYWLNDTYISGLDTKISYVPYKNELNLNIFPMHIKTLRPGNTLLEGILRGVYNIMSNIADRPSMAPSLGSVVQQEDNYYLTVRSSEYSTPNIYFLIMLNNWR